jgi:hypothetical protein
MCIDQWFEQATQPTKWPAANHLAVRNFAVLVQFSKDRLFAAVVSP